MTRPPRGGACWTAGHVPRSCARCQSSASCQVAGAVILYTLSRSQGHSESSRDPVTRSRSPDVLVVPPIPTQQKLMCGPGGLFAALAASDGPNSREVEQVFNSSCYLEPRTMRRQRTRYRFRIDNFQGCTEYIVVLGARLRSMLRSKLNRTRRRHDLSTFLVAVSKERSWCLLSLFTCINDSVIKISQNYDN